MTAVGSANPHAIEYITLVIGFAFYRIAVFSARRNHK
jgi:hypothetical protein